MSQPFTGLTIAISGFVGKTYRTIENEIKSNGGTFVATIEPGCTHLVSTDKAHPKAKKNEQAIALDGGPDAVRIVNADWLYNSRDNGSREPETSYLLHPFKNSPTATSGVKSASNDSKPDTKNKRALADSNEEDGDDDEDTNAPKTKEPPTKKKKGNATASKSNGTSKTKDTGKTKSADTKKQQAPINVPVDMPGRTNYNVHIDGDTIYDAALNQTNSMANNNKFYILQLLAATTAPIYVVWTRWGRVGEKGQSAPINCQDLDDAIKTFQKKFKDKSGLNWDDRRSAPKKGKYAYLERSYEDDDDEQPKTVKKKTTEEEDIKIPDCTLKPEVQEVVGLIFNQKFFAQTMREMQYDANKLPLGKLSKRTLLQGFEILKELSEIFADPTKSALRSTAMDLSNQYFTLIPHVFGRSRPPVLQTPVLIKREIDLLEALSDMEITNQIMDASAKLQNAASVHPLDTQYMGLGLNEMTPINSATTEYFELSNYLMKTRGHTHHLQYSLMHIFRLERQGEPDRFKQSSFANLPNSNRRLLWHGSRTTNYGGILSQGLRIAPPEAPVSGYMFGKGVYFADVSSKSANYCCSGCSNNIGLLMLCDVELGDPMLELTDSDYNAGENAKKNGSYSTLGMGQTTPAAWKDAGCVHEDLAGAMMPNVLIPDPLKTSSNGGPWLQYNEYIVYDVNQIRIKYLFAVKM
ncbi:hypothetical protein FQN57_005430 [Myotisia sp. PD_48]|nr:hypothetical protein FQN57_005430 [Myotisia sp. PD_48]